MIAVEDALRKAKTFEKSGPVYEHIHSRLWPIHEILQQLFGQVQIGAQGGQVMIVQDTMNRLQNVDAASGNSFPLLAVDGQFGPKTHARVKEFQGKNGLVADGIVGPNTRAKLVLKGQSFANA